MDEAFGKDKFDDVVLNLSRSALLLSFDETMRAFKERPAAERRYPTEVTDLGYWLIGRGIVTSWQFANICKGKWRGFFELPDYKLLDHLETDNAYSYYLVEGVNSRRQMVARVTPKSRSKVLGTTEFKIVPEFPHGPIAMIKGAYGRSMRKRKLEQIVKDLGRSGLIEPFQETMRAFGKRPTAEHIHSPGATDLGRWLVGKSLLTHWQLKMLSEGKRKGFFMDGYKMLDHLNGTPGDGHYLAERMSTGVRVVLRIFPPAPGDNAKEAGYMPDYKIEKEFRGGDATI